MYLVILWALAVSHMDDILVFSKYKEQHICNFFRVLSSFLASDLCLKPSNCELYKEKVSFLGNVVLRYGHAIFFNKTKAITDFSKPHNKTKVHFFLISLKFFEPVLQGNIQSG